MKTIKSLTTAVPAMIVLAVATAIPACAQNGASAREQQPLKLVKTFPLPGTIKGHFDHLIVDTKGMRLFATPEDFHAVLVLNATTGKLEHEIQGIEKPHAVLYRPEIDRIYITDGEDGSLKVFNSKTYQLEARVPLLKDADSIGYDPATKYLYIDNGGGDVGQKYSMLSVVDTTRDKKLADIRVEGDTLEAMAIDPNRPQLYVNNRDKNTVAVVDTSTRKVIATWPVTMGKTNITMALDVEHHRLFVGCRSGQMVVLDTNTGHELQAYPIVKGVDDLAYDEASKRLYAAGDGAVSVYEELDADHYRLLGNVPTGPLGKTARLSPDLDEYFVAVPQHGTTSASIMVFKQMHATEAADTPPPAPAYHVEAPKAEHLVIAELSSHPYLQKLGLHATEPGHSQSVIIANGNTSKIGKATTEKDMLDVKGGKTYCHKDDEDSFYDMKLPMVDASGHHIGLLVMEIPFSAASSPEDAIKKAESIRKEMASQIPSLDSLFKS